MNTPDSPSEFLFLFRGTDFDRDLSPKDLQHTISLFFAWFERLSADGILKSGQPLMDDARIVSGKNGRAVADGPFAESKEAIGGYFLIKAANLEEAVALAQQCPTLEYGVSVEVRAIAGDCSVRQRATQQHAEQPELATATA